MDACVFCKIVASEIPSQKVWESPAVFAFSDLNPQAPTHVLVVPKRHIASLADARPQDQALLGEVNYAAAAEQGSFRRIARGRRRDVSGCANCPRDGDGRFR